MSPFATLQPQALPSVCLGITFSLVDSVYELAHLEDLLVDDEVVMTWEFQVKGTAAGADGVCISVEMLANY